MHYQQEAVYGMNIYKKWLRTKNWYTIKTRKLVEDGWLGGENEFDCLFQGFKSNNAEGLNVLEWIPKTTVPAYKTFTYPRYTTAVRPEKDKKYQVWITGGSDCIDFESDVSTHTVSMETIKIHCNSIISTPNAKYCTSDISNMYLMSDLVNSEYVKFKVNMILPRIIAHYKLKNLIHDGYIYAKINKALYGLK